jgi:predicted patatin/cPLA2 family phospholipase
MKTLVLSGGGSKGAFTGGMLEYMKTVEGRDYELYLGTSTGSLLQTLAAINEFGKLKEAYTTLNLDEIYDISPYKKTNDPEKAKINIWSVLRMCLLRKEPTFGDSTNLQDKMRKTFSRKDFDKARSMGKTIIPCVTNLTKVREEYYSSNDISYEEFMDWTWISTNAVPFSSMVKRNGDYYADGGFMEHMPIHRAIELGATEIDAITTKPENHSIDQNLDFGSNPLKLIEHIIDVMMWESFKRDIDVAKYMAVEKDVTINIYYAPRTLTNNPMYFDKRVMSEWWEEGYNYMMDNHVNNKVACKTIKLKRKKSKKKKK